MAGNSNHPRVREITLVFMVVETFCCRLVAALSLHPAGGGSQSCSFNGVMVVE
jgi:hypothetical protein